ncbi:hypothetical protein ACWG0P_05600 [Amedibacillus sp. YH-ame6]
MIRIIESYDLIAYWNDNLKSVRSNSHSDSISPVKIMDNYGMLISEKGTVKLIYFDSFLKSPVLMDDGEVLEFIDVMADKESKQIGCNERVDILLNIICKKAGLNYISDLKRFHVDSYMVCFVNRQKYQEEWKYVLEYLES